jgi:catechol 2,3-dioxygenase-like lactoylglutathione lyase family enzyme
MIVNSKILPTVAVEDLDAAKTFYHETLGLEIGMQDGMQVVFESKDGSMLYVYRKGPAVHDPISVALEVQDIDAEVQELRRKGVKFEDLDVPGLGLKTVDGIATSRDGDYEDKSAWFRDAAGNMLVLHQRTPVGASDRKGQAVGSGVGSRATPLDAPDVRC